MQDLPDAVTCQNANHIQQNIVHIASAPQRQKLANFYQNKKEKTSDSVDKSEVAKLERRLNVIHISVYILVVIAVFRIYLMIAA